MLDNIDKKLLYELNWDCRQTNSSLAKKLRISKQVVNYRIKRLESAKVISHYAALIDWRKLGYNAIRAYIKWRNMAPEEEEKVYDMIRNNNFFIWTAKVEGEFDFATYMWVKTIPEFAEKWFKLMEKYRGNILKQEIYESVNMVFYPLKMLSDSGKHEEKIIGNGSKEKYDDKDYEILKILNIDARLPVVKIAEQVGLTSKSVIYRMKQMEKKGILLGYNAVFDSYKWKEDFYKIDFYMNDLSRIKEMEEYAKQHPKIWARMRTIGGPDYEIEVLVKDTKELKKIIREIRTRFCDVIEHYRFHRFTNIKLMYLPGEN